MCKRCRIRQPTPCYRLASGLEFRAGSRSGGPVDHESDLAQVKSLAPLQHMARELVDSLRRIIGTVPVSRSDGDHRAKVTIYFVERDASRSLTVHVRTHRDAERMKCVEGEVRRST